MQYEIYGFVRLILRSEDSRYVRYFDNEYRRMDELYAGSGEARCCITVHIVSRLPSEQLGDIRRDVTFKRLFRFSYLVRGLRSNDVHLYFRKHRVGRVYVTAVGVFLQAQVLEPILYMKLLEQQVLLMHCAGVACGEYGYVFPACGGAGKTTLSLSLVREGFKLLGDDLLPVDPSYQRVYAYPRPLHLFTYNIHSLRNADVPLGIRAAIRAKDICRFLLERLTGEQFLISTRVHVEELYDDVRFSEPVTYRKIMFLRKDGQPERIRLVDEARREVAKTIVASSDLNKSLYSNILDGDSELIERVRALEIDVTERILEKVEEIEFVNTRELDLQDLSSFADDLRS